MIRRTAGQGAIEVRAGKYRFRIRLADGTRRNSPLFDTREECELVLAAALAELAEGRMAPVGAVLLGPFGDRWLSHRTVRSAHHEQSLWRLHVKGTTLAELPVRDVRQRHIREFLAQLRTKRRTTSAAGKSRGARLQTTECLSAQTVKLTFSLLRRVLAEAVAQEVITLNPATGLRMPREQESHVERWTYLTQEEIRRLLDCEDIPRESRLLFAVAIFTGMRAGELWGLRWCDIDLEASPARCVVRRSMEGPTKSGTIRAFPLVPRAEAALRELRGLRVVSELVFPNPQGAMFAKGYDGGWATLRKRAGITRRVRFHDLRHTCASHLLMGTWGPAWQLADVRDFLGHSSVAVTERYAHLSQGRLDGLARGQIEAADLGPKRDQEAQILVPASTVTWPYPPSVTTARFERATYCLGNSCSIQLSYAVKTTGSVYHDRFGPCHICDRVPA